MNSKWLVKLINSRMIYQLKLKSAILLSNFLLSILRKNKLPNAKHSAFSREQPLCLSVSIHPNFLNIFSKSVSSPLINDQNSHSNPKFPTNAKTRLSSLLRHYTHRESNKKVASAPRIRSLGSETAGDAK